MKPKNNKFHKGNKIDGKHYWLTPNDLMEQLNNEFKFDFPHSLVNPSKSFGFG